LAAGEIDYPEFLARVCSSAPSLGHCNTMGTASTMNALAEALGMMLPGTASIPAPWRARMEAAYATGKRIVEMAHEDLTPSKVITRAAIENVIRVCTAIGGSTNAPIHFAAIARHAGVEHDITDWERLGFDLPLLVNMQPAGEYLGEDFQRAGGTAAVMGELLAAGMLDGSALRVSGRTVAEDYADWRSQNAEVIRTPGAPLREEAGFLVISGNLFDSALMKTSVISRQFSERYLGENGVFEGRAIVFEGPEDYHHRLNDPGLGIDDGCMLFIRGTGPVGYPGGAEVVNMQPPDALIAQGVQHLPTIGDGRQSGTSESPSILNASPESVRGGGLALLKTGDMVRLDIPNRRMDALVPEGEWQARRDSWEPPELDSHTPWQELQRGTVGDLASGACLEFATRYRRTSEVMERDNH
ncbi:MAG TPA: dihydroxy-acid dehydratase, partial [Paracoccaceae bacterium]|nr:dihydroxy-acid dehydratase [Paracoccaceae bacterium]